MRGSVPVSSVQYQLVPHLATSLLTLPPARCSVIFSVSNPSREEGGLTQATRQMRLQDRILVSTRSCMLCSSLLDARWETYFINDYFFDPSAIPLKCTLPFRLGRESASSYYNVHSLRVSPDHPIGPIKWGGAHQRSEADLSRNPSFRNSRISMKKLFGVEKTPKMEIFCFFFSKAI